MRGFSLATGAAALAGLASYGGTIGTAAAAGRSYRKPRRAPWRPVEWNRDEPALACEPLARPGGPAWDALAAPPREAARRHAERAGAMQQPI